MNIREVLKQSMDNNGSLFPVGRPFAGLPLITEMTYGLHGIFLLAGATKVGKTTLASRLVAGVVDAEFPGVYYEHEDGLAPQRVLGALGGDLDDPRLDHLAHAKKFDEAVDLVRALPRPGFLVVDTIQGSLDIEDHDARLDAGVLHALERRMKLLTDLHREGHAVLVVSQINDRVSTAPPTLAAIKGASAIEHHATAIVAYGGRVQDPVRHLVLRRLRRPVNPAWPVDSKVALRTDGQDRLTEEAAGQQKAQPPTRRETPSEKVAAARLAHPGASVRQLAAATGLSKSMVHRHLSQQVSQWDSSGTVGGTAELPGMARS